MNELRRVRRGVDDQVEARTGRELRGQLGDLLLDVVDHVDAVRVGQFDHDQRDALLAIDADDRVALLVGVLDLGDVLQIDGAAAGPRDDHLAQVAHLGGERVEVDVEVGAALGDAAGRDLELFGLERVADVVDRQSSAAERVLVDGDVDLVGDAGADACGADAGQGVELELKVVLGQVFELGQGLLAREDDGGYAGAR